MSYPYLKDQNFLNEIDYLRQKTQYVNITVLNWIEKPIRAIEGRATDGTINLNGSSAMRRTANVTFVIESGEFTLQNVSNLLSINKKIKLEVGIKNTTKKYSEYPIIWFPQGIYVITDPTITYGVNQSVTVSLQLKDKMCLLNGDVGGIFPASVTFSEEDILNEDGEYETVKPTIYRIIQQCVHEFGGEQLGKIIISDVDERIKQVMKWVGTDTLYITKKTVDGQTGYSATTSEAAVEKDKENGIIDSYEAYEYGDDIGYIYTDFTYPGDLIGDAGGNVCTILDSIKSVLGNYEYFYDVEGCFHFQEIKNYLNTSKSTVDLEEMEQSDYLMSVSHSKAAYVFKDNSLITTFSNAPQYSMIKNDFIVWGIRETSTGSQVPIRYHLAIDTKPETGNTYPVFFYEDPDTGVEIARRPYPYSQRKYFPETGDGTVYYLDQSTNIVYKWDTTLKSYIKMSNQIENITTKDWRTELYMQGAQADVMSLDTNGYYSELSNEWPQLYDMREGKFLEEVTDDPSSINYFLDFIDSEAAISEFSISNIGKRSKVITDNDINCIFEPNIPDLVLINNGDDATVVTEKRNECEAKGQDYIQIEESLYEKIASGGSKNSAYAAVRDLLYQYTSYNESISVQAIPIFYLDTNIRITINDRTSGIYGDYIINSISFPLNVSSTMTLSATRAIEKI